MTNQEYRKHEGLSRSELKILLDQTPEHFLYAKNNPKEDTASLSFGRACHKYILEKSDFYNEFAVMPVVDRRTKEGKARYEAFLQSCGSKEVISIADLEDIQEMADRIDRDPFARLFLNEEAKYEQSFFWTDSETGVKCKVRPDCITEVNGKKYIVDYKTTDSCADGHFERSVRKYGYKFQAGMYREGVFQNTFEDYGFVFIAQEKTAPYSVRVYICSEDFINEGYDQFREAVGKYAWCEENNCFYGYEGPQAEMSELLGEGD